MDAMANDIRAIRRGDHCGAVVDLGGGRLWVTTATEPVDGLGNVEHLVAATAEQARQLSAWSLRYPEAHCWCGASGDGSGLPLHTPLVDDHAPDRWGNQLELRRVRGNGHAEVWFVHTSSHTAILPRAPTLRERLAFLGLRRHLSQAADWLQHSGATSVIEDGSPPVANAPAHIAHRIAWIGADGPIPPSMRFAVGANPGGAATFAVALTAVAGLLAGLTIDAPFLGARLVTAVVLGDLTCGVMARALPSTRAWWDARGPTWKAGLLGLHLAHPLLLIAALGGSAWAGIGLWLTALVGAAVVPPLGLAVVVVGAVVFAEQLPGPAWWPALYLLKLMRR